MNRFPVRKVAVLGAGGDGSQIARPSSTARARWSVRPAREERAEAASWPRPSTGLNKLNPAPLGIP